MDSTLSEFDAYWPSWPTGTQGEVLAEVYLGCSVDHLVELLWANESQFQVLQTADCGLNSESFVCLYSL